MKTPEKTPAPAPAPPMSPLPAPARNAALLPGVDRFFRSPLLTQAAVLALAAFALHVVWIGVGFNIVMYGYYAGGQAFLGGLNPYEATLPLGLNNSYKYSPQFALLAGEMAYAGFDGRHAAHWVLALYTLASTALFAAGLARWSDFRARPPGGVAPWCAAIALAAAVVDLVVSTGVYQVNAFCAGLTLLGLADYRDGHRARAGALLLSAILFKVYAVMFFFMLALRFKPRYWLGAIAAGAVAFLLPVPAVGWAHNFNTHIAWVKSTLSVAGTYTILDLRSAFEHVGLGTPGGILRQVVMIVTIPVFLIYGIGARKPDWRPWLTCGIAAFLLISPKTEVFTFVFLAATYVMMVEWCAGTGDAFFKKYGAVLFALCAVVIASARFIDPLWYKSENPREIQRVLGALGIWGMSAWILGAAAWRHFAAALGAPGPEPEPEPKKQPGIAIAIPTYNEAGNIGRLLRAISEAVKTRPGASVEALVIDDSSPDGTAARVREFAREPGAGGFTVSLLSRAKKEGLGRAYIHGFKHLLAKGGADYIMQMDADFSHDPKYIARFIDAAAGGADFVVASRYRAGGGVPDDWGWFRKFQSRWGNWFARLMLEPGLTDYTGGFNMYKATLLAAIDPGSISATGYGFLIELKYKALLKSGARAEIPIIFSDRAIGKSKIPGNTILKSFWLVFKLRRTSVC
jgi:dolichol-phosphate mannosyltransferase